MTVHLPNLQSFKAMFLASAEIPILSKIYAEDDVSPSLLQIPKALKAGRSGLMKA